MTHGVTFFGRRVFTTSEYPNRLQWLGENGETEVGLEGAGWLIMNAPITGLERVCAGVLIHTTQRDYLMTGTHPIEYRLWMGGPFECYGCNGLEAEHGD
jgi:hypothetical protein